MDYMRTPDEVQKTTEAYYWLQRIANGNENAYRLLVTIWNWSHVLDDLVDRDKPVTIQDAAHWFIKFTHELSFNPFYRDNAPYLFGLLMSMCNRWVDGAEWEESDDPLKKSASHVIKCGDLDLYLGVAYLTGGWEHVRACRDARSYDLNGLELAWKELYSNGNV